VSGVPVVNDRHDRKEPGCRQLLAVRALRRSLERVALADGLVSWAPIAVTRPRRRANRGRRASRVRPAVLV